MRGIGDEEKKQVRETPARVDHDTEAIIAEFGAMFEAALNGLDDDEGED